MELILGHNQFIGVSHISEDRAREREKRFSKVEHIYRVVEAASDVGFTSMLIETHPRMLEFMQYYQKNKTFDMNFYLQVPHVQRYVQMINQSGMKGFLSELISSVGLGTTSALAVRSAINMLKKDYLAVGLSYLKLEVAPFTEFKVKGLILHNTLTDLLMALGVSTAFSEFNQYVTDKLKLKFGLATWNFMLVTRNLDQWGVHPSFVMAPINVKGFDMNPSQHEVEAALRRYNGEVIAMNVLGGGAYSVPAAVSYVKSFGAVKKCVVGASSAEHLRELMQTFNSATDLSPGPTNCV